LTAIKHHPLAGRPWGGDAAIFRLYNQAIPELEGLAIGRQQHYRGIAGTLKINLIKMSPADLLKSREIEQIFETCEGKLMCARCAIKRLGLG